MTLFIVHWQLNGVREKKREGAGSRVGFEVPNGLECAYVVHSLYCSLKMEEGLLILLPLHGGGLLRARRYFEICPPTIGATLKKRKEKTQASDLELILSPFVFALPPPSPNTPAAAHTNVPPPRQKKGLEETIALLLLLLLGVMPCIALCVLRDRKERDTKPLLLSARLPQCKQQSVAESIRAPPSTKKRVPFSIVHNLFLHTQYNHIFSFFFSQDVREAKHPEYHEQRHRQPGAVGHVQVPGRVYTKHFSVRMLYFPKCAVEFAIGNSRSFYHVLSCNNIPFRDCV